MLLNFLACLPTPFLYPHHVTPSADKRAATTKSWDWVPLERSTALVRCPISLLSSSSLCHLVLLAALPGLSSLGIWGPQARLRDPD